MSSYRAICWSRILTIVPFLPWSASLGTAAEQDEITSRTLMQRVKSGDLTVDFRVLRLACMKSIHCEPRGTKEDLAEINRAADSHQLNKLVEIAEGLIERGIVNVEAHANLVKPNAELNEPVKAKFHLDVTNALLRSIFATGVAKTRGERI